MTDARAPKGGASNAVLYLTGLLSLGMGAGHLFLPTIFGWSQAMASAPDSLQWALGGLNVFWSLSIGLTGVLGLLIANRGWRRQPAARAALSLLALYWALHAGYLLLWPFPLPQTLAWLGWTFLGFATAQCLLHLTAATVK